MSNRSAQLRELAEEQEVIDVVFEYLNNRGGSPPTVAQLRALVDEAIDEFQDVWAAVERSNA